MSKNSLPRAANHAEKVSHYLETLRSVGRDMVADYMASLFDSGVLFIDSSGRIVEATATTEEAP